MKTQAAGQALDNKRLESSLLVFRGPNAVGGSKDKQGDGIIFFSRP